MTGKITLTGLKISRKEVIPSMKRDAIWEIAVNDDLILGIGDLWVMKNIDNKRKRKHYSSFHVCLAARLKRIKCLEEKGRQRLGWGVSMTCL